LLLPARHAAGVTGSDHAGQRQSRLLGCAVGTAGEPPAKRELVPTSHLARLSQARGHLCASEVFVHEVHGSVPVRLRGGHRRGFVVVVPDGFIALLLGIGSVVRRG